MKLIKLVKNKNIGFIIVLIFILGVVAIPKTVAKIGEIGTDPNNDVLRSNPSTLLAFGDWVGNFYVGDDPSNATELFDEDNSYWFDIVDSPECIDVESWGIDGDDLYIEVEDITDWVDDKYFSICILVIYNTTTEFGYNDIIYWYAIIDIYDGEIHDNIYVAEFNIDLPNEDEEFGSVVINEETNTYKLEFEPDWIDETNSSIIINDMHGCVVGFRYNTTFIDDISEFTIDVFPNSLFGQTIEPVVDDNDDQIIYTAIILSTVLLLGLTVFILFKKRKIKLIKRGKKR